MHLLKDTSDKGGNYVTGPHMSGQGLSANLPGICRMVSTLQYSTYVYCTDRFAHSDPSCPYAYIYLVRKSKSSELSWSCPVSPVKIKVFVCVCEPVGFFGNVDIISLLLDAG